MVTTAVLGFPRVGPDRELKFALETFWRSELDADGLGRVARERRHHHLRVAAAAGIDVLPSGDLALYDHVLDAALAVGAVPGRFSGLRGLEREFAMARGTAEAPPLELTKWFDTNLHHLVPELAPDQRFAPDPTRLVAAHAEARAWGVETRPTLLGPLTLLLLAKGPDRLRHADALGAAYGALLRALRDAGAREVQLDEPALVLDRAEDELRALERLWGAMHAAAPELELCLTAPYGTLGDALARVLALPAAEVHLDLTRAPELLAPALDAARATGTRLSLGVIDGRNVWAADLDAALALADRALGTLGEARVRLAPSCSLVHVPYVAARERGLDPELRSWLAFAHEKLQELALLARALEATPAERDALLAPSRAVRAGRAASPRTRTPAVRARVAQVRPADLTRRPPLAERAALQAERLGLPELPTTTIGSFPQTDDLRAARRALRAGTLAQDDYDALIAGRIREDVARQEELGLDVLVHGEPERTDMVEHFAAQLEGFALTEHGWVQSYGSRCVKPPVLFGDVHRPAPMTVRWWRVAQEATAKPVKGMLTGPVTLLAWSFVRDDQPREETARQLALAVRDEAADLEAAGAAAIQVDEAALREGLPLRAADREAYLRWAVDAFRLATGGLDGATQVHSHLCYSELADVVDALARLDADVLSVEASRSAMDLPAALAAHPGALGPGVYDIHAPRVPSTEEVEALLARAEAVVPRERLWVNPDCGLKTRRFEEVLPALRHLVEAARRRRAAAPAGAPGR